MEKWIKILMYLPTSEENLAFLFNLLSSIPQIVGNQKLTRMTIP